MEAKCCANEAVTHQDKLAKVDEVIARYKDKKGALIPVLHEVQRVMGNYLTEEVLIKVAEGLNVPFNRVYGTATFYTLFSVKPRGKYIVRICESAPCHIKGAVDVIKAFEDELGIKVGETTPDGKFTLEYTACLGICGVAPAVMINDEMYGNLNPEKVKELIKKF
jgi:NADH-quinone oxidoreductase E subunit